MLIADQIEKTGHALTAEDLAELLSVSKVTIFKQAAAGRIPVVSGSARASDLIREPWRLGCEGCSDRQSVGRGAANSPTEQKPEINSFAPPGTGPDDGPKRLTRPVSVPSLLSCRLSLARNPFRLAARSGDGKHQRQFTVCVTTAEALVLLLLSPA
jgi:hypothetical protein